MEWEPERPPPAAEDAGRDTTDLTGKSARGFAWTMGGLLVTEPLRVVMTAILARILTPDDFGLVAMAAVVTGLLAFANDLGFSVALIQRERLTRRETDAVFWLNLAVGATLTVAAWAGAPAVAALYGEPGVTWVFRGLSLAFAATSLHLVQGALVRREMDFRTPAFASIWSVGTVAAVSVSLASAGYGAMSIVAGNLAGLLANAVYLQWATRYVPRHGPSWRHARDFVSFGATLTVGELAGYGAGNADNLVIGRVLGAGPIGQYSIAYNLVTYPVRRVAKMAAAVTLPAFSAIGGDRERFREAYLRALGLSAVLVWPGLACAAALGPDVVLGLYGRQWAAAVIPFQVLCVAAMALVCAVFGEMALKALGRARAFALWAAGSFVVLAAGVVWWVSSGIVAVAAAVSVATVVSCAIVQVIAARVLDMSSRRVAAALAFPAGMALAAAAGGFVAARMGDALGLEGLVVAVPGLAAVIAACWLVGRMAPGSGALSLAEDLARSLVRRGAS